MGSYPNKFADGHKHVYSGTSASGLPQCVKCGRVNTKGTSSTRGSSSKSPIQNEFSGFDFSDLTKPAPKRTTTKKTTAKKSNNNVNNGITPQTTLFGEQYRIETTMKPSEASVELDKYLKNRLPKEERMRRFPRRFNKNA